MRLIDADAFERELIEVANYRCKTHPKWEQPFRICDLILWRQPTINNWIPVSEKLPQDEEVVLICHDGYIISIDFVRNGEWQTYKNVDAWMPLPEPYKESEEE